MSHLLKNDNHASLYYKSFFLIKQKKNQFHNVCDHKNTKKCLLVCLSSSFLFFLLQLMQITIHVPSIWKKIAFRSVNKGEKPEKELINTMYSNWHYVTRHNSSLCFLYIFSSLMYLMCAPQLSLNFVLLHIFVLIFFFFSCTLFNFFSLCFFFHVRRKK